MPLMRSDGTMIWGWRSGDGIGPILARRTQTPVLLGDDRQSVAGGMPTTSTLRAERSTFGRICLEAFDRNPGDFGRTVMDLLERDYGVAPLDQALRAPVEGRAALAKAVS